MISEFNMRLAKIYTANPSLEDDEIEDMIYDFNFLFDHPKIGGAILSELTILKLVYLKHPIKGKPKNQVKAIVERVLGKDFQYIEQYIKSLVDEGLIREKR